MKKMKNKAGFSLIELLVVITITVILLSIGMVSYAKAGQSTRNGKRRQDLETGRQALVLYRVNEGAYPGSTEGVQAGLTNANYTVVINELRSGSYLKIDNVLDPKNEDPYLYSYEGSDGRSFQVCAYLEPEGIALPPTCLTNP